MPPVGRPRSRTDQGTVAPTRQIAVPSLQGGATTISNLQTGAGLGWNQFVDEAEFVPELMWPTSVRWYDQMRTDSQLAALYTAVAYGITQLRWIIDPNHARQEVVDGVSEDLNLPVRGQDDWPRRRMKSRFAHSKHIRQAMLALIYGHMYFEQVGEIINGKWRLRKLVPIMPRTIENINMADDGGLVSVQQFRPMNADFSKPPPEIPVDRLVGFIFEQEGANWVGRSMLRDCYKDWLIKDRLVRVDAINHERAGGVPLAAAPAGATPGEVDALSRMMQDFRVGETSGGAVPYGTDITVARATNSKVVDSISQRDEAMARRFLLMLVNLAQSGQHVGSYALGETFEDFFIVGQRAITQWYCDVMTEYLIEDWVDWNYGPDEPAPLLVFERVDDDSLPSADLAELVRYGAITVDDSTEEWLRDRHKMPKLDQPRPVPVAAPKLMDPSAEQPAAVADATATDALKAGRRPHPMLRKASFVSAQNPHGEARFAGDTGEYADRLPDRKLHRAPTHHEIASMADFKKLDEMWNAATDKLIADYKAKVLPGQLASIKKQQLKAKTIGELASVTVEATGAELMAKHLIDTAKAGIETAHEEAVAQGVTDAEKIGVSAVEDLLASRAQGAAILMANALSEIAGRKAVTIADPANIDNKAIATAVIDHIDGLSDRFLKDNLGGAITGAQNDGRAAQMENTEGGQIFSSELLDSDCCEECAAVDSTEYEDMAEARADYPAGGYIDCLGGPRCRGGLITVYDAQAQEDL